jgi:calcium permeable stress-gated cation channel
MMRWISKYQGALTQSRLDRAVLARYFAFLVISQLIIFTLIGVGFSAYQLFQCDVVDAELTADSVSEIIKQIGQHNSFREILDNIDSMSC